MTTADAAHVLNISATSVRLLCDTGHFPNAFRLPLGRRDWRIPAEDVNALIDRQRVASHPQKPKLRLTGGTD